MQLMTVSPMYVIFDGLLLYPSVLNVGGGNFIDNNIKNNLIKEGLILPFTRAPLTDRITLEYLSGPDYSYNNNKLFALLRNDGMFEEFFRYDSPPRMDSGVISEKITRFLFNDEGLHHLISPMLLESESIDHFANLLEVTLAMSTTLWEVYKIKDLQAMLLGNLPIEKLKSRKIKSDYKVIYLK